METTPDNEKIWGEDINRQKVLLDRKQLVFQPAVYGVLIKDEKVLLVKQFDGYDFPGGSVKLGETIDEAFEREVWEETGLRANKGELLLCENSFFLHPVSKKQYHSILLFYTCAEVKGEINDEHFSEHEKKYASLAEWVPIERVDSLKFFNPIDSPALIKKVANFLHS